MKSVLFKNEPLYKQALRELKRIIGNGGFKSGELPTERELSKQFNISRMTVRQALEELKKDGTVFQVQGKGTFIFKKANTFKPRNIKNIGFLIFEPYFRTYPYYNSILEGIQSKLERKKYDLQIYEFTPNGLENGQNVVFQHAMNAGLIDGVIIGGSINESGAEYLQKNRIPSIFVNTRFRTLKLNTVGPDVAKTAGLAMDYLISKNRKKTGIIGGPMESNNREIKYTEDFLVKFGAILAKNKLKLDSTRVKTVARWDCFEEAGEKYLELLKGGADSVIILSEGLFRGIYPLMQKEHVSRDKVEVITLSDKKSGLPVTCLTTDINKYGQEAYRLLDGILSGKIKQPAEVMIEPGLVIAGTRNKEERND